MRKHERLMKESIDPATQPKKGRRKSAFSLR